MSKYAKDRIEIRTHALDIPDRVRALDERLTIMLNRKTQRYEIWRSEPDGATLECVLPYDQLDARTVGHVRAHRIERLEMLQREIEEHNRRLEEKTRRAWLEKAGELTREAVKYLNGKADKDEAPDELIKEARRPVGD